jgi:serine/threonine-protein kinase RsbW/stage II sporulation protein AB (anti-sigma F factor)
MMAAPTGERRIELRIPARAEHVPPTRHDVVAFAQRRGIDDAAMVGLAVSEAISNAIVHAYRDGRVGDVEVTVHDADDHLLVTVRDYGIGLSPRVDSPGMGVGLPLIGTLADDVQLERLDDGTAITMTFAKPVTRSG